MKQTAVEWLEEQFNNTNIPSSQIFFKQAKAMEKEQMHKCASFWRGKENEIEKPIFEQYYNETFGNPELVD